MDVRGVVVDRPKVWQIYISDRVELDWNMLINYFPLAS